MTPTTGARYARSGLTCSSAVLSSSTVAGIYATKANGSLSLERAVLLVGGQANDEDAVRRVQRRQALDRAVVQHASFVDQDDPAAESLDVGEVVGREDDRRPTIAVHLRDEGPDALLGEDVEPDRPLVEVDDPRVVEERRREVPAHTLAEAQLTHRRLDEFVEAEDLPESPQVASVSIGRDPVHPGHEIERLDQRQVPPQLAALAEHHPDIQRVFLPAPPWHQACDFEGAGCRDQDAGQHLDRGRLACAVGTDIPDQLSALHGEGDAVDRGRRVVLACEQGAQRPERSPLAPRGTERLGESIDPDDRVSDRGVRHPTDPRTGRLRWCPGPRSRPRQGRPRSAPAPGR